MSATGCEDLLRQALKWALSEGISVTSLEGGYRDSGCGCCSGSVEPPAELSALVTEVRKEILTERGE